MSVKEVVGEDGKPDLLLTMVYKMNDVMKVTSRKVDNYLNTYLLLLISGPKQINVCWQTSNWRIFEEAPNLQVDW